MLSMEPVERSSMQKTSSPRATYASERCEPMKPAPPVMRTRKTFFSPSFKRGAADSAPRGVGVLRLALRRGRAARARRAQQLFVEAQHVLNQTLDRVVA